MKQAQPRHPTNGRFVKTPVKQGKATKSANSGQKALAKPMKGK